MHIIIFYYNAYYYYNTYSINHSVIFYFLCLILFSKELTN